MSGLVGYSCRIYLYLTLQAMTANIINEQEQRTHSSQFTAGLVSAFDKINILTSGDSSRLAAKSFNLTAYRRR